MLRITSSHQVGDSDVHPEEVEHVVELARGCHYQGVGRRAQERHHEPEILHDLR